jgi:uncharacterized protein
MKNARFRITNAVMPLIAVNIIFYLLQMTIGRSFTDNFALVSAELLSRPWMLLTHMFLHGSPNHIFFNMFALIMFGPILEQKIGARRFLTIYLLSGLVAGFISSFFYTKALGASGAIMGMLGALIILIPNLRLLFFFVIPMPLWFAGLLWAALDTFGIFFPSGVGNIAHLAGLGFGILCGLYLKKQKHLFQKRFGSKKHIDEYDAEEYMRTGRI